MVTQKPYGSRLRLQSLAGAPCGTGDSPQHRHGLRLFGLLVAAVENASWSGDLRRSRELVRSVDGQLQLARAVFERHLRAVHRGSRSCRRDVGQMGGARRSEEVLRGQRAECAVIGVGFTGLLSLFNIGGRFVWAVLSDRIGRKNTFYCIFLLGMPLYALMPALSAHGNLILFVAGLCVLMSMFGGAFAVVPAYLSDLFGSEMISAIQGRVLTAWSTAGIIGPLLIGTIRDFQVGNGVDLARAYDPAFYVIAGLLLVGLICNTLVRPVPDHCFMSSGELERHRHGSRHNGPETRSAENTVEIGLTLTATVAGAWLAVCIPIGWGICMTVARAAVLL